MRRRTLSAGDANAGTDISTLTALRADGVPLLSQTIPGRPLFGDSFGGLVGTVATPENGDLDVSAASGQNGDHDDRRATQGVLRVGGSSAATPWRYESAGWLQGGLAQAADGTIYGVERIRNPSFPDNPYTRRLDTQIVVIDGATGTRSGSV